MANRIKRNDVVVVTAGKDKGKRGRVMRILKGGDRVVVEGINLVTKHRRNNPQNPSAGGRVEEEAPVHASNLMPWSEKDGKGVRVRMEEKDGKKYRVSSASNSKLIFGAAPTPQSEDAKQSGNEDKGGDE